MVAERLARIKFYLEKKSHVVLRVFNSEDKEVRLLINELLPAGAQNIVFSFGNLSTAEYIIRLVVNGENAVDIETVNIKIN